MLVLGVLDKMVEFDPRTVAVCVFGEDQSTRIIRSFLEDDGYTLVESPEELTPEVSERRCFVARARLENVNVTIERISDVPQREGVLGIAYSVADLSEGVKSRLGELGYGNVFEHYSSFSLIGDTIENHYAEKD
jgi:hypothetical protein